MNLRTATVSFALLASRSSTTTTRTTVSALAPIKSLRSNRLSTRRWIPSTTSFLSMSTSSSQPNSKPFAVVVQAEIQPDRMDEFLALMETNARETRKEPGCYTFDVLRSHDNPNQFVFYELYENVQAIDHHKQQSHYQAWADFKESGGTVSSETLKADGWFTTK